MTQTNNIQCELINGIGFFAEADGVEYRSTDGVNWLRSNGKHPGNQMLIALRTAAFEAMGKARDKQDTPDPLADLTPEERKAVEGALRDAGKGLRAGVEFKLYGRMKAVARLSGLSDEDWKHSMGDPFNPDAPGWQCYSVVWDTRTGTRTVLDVDAFREAWGVESEEWEAWLSQEAKRKREDDGVIAATWHYDPEGFFKRNPSAPYTHLLNATTGKWHERPNLKPEPATFSGDPREWGVGTFVYTDDTGHRWTVGVWGKYLVLIDSEGDSGGWVPCDWELGGDYTRISTTPPRIVVEGAEQ